MNKETEAYLARIKKTVDEARAMAEKTGNAELAHCVNCTVHPINLNQSRVAGMPKLFNPVNNAGSEEGARQSA